MKIAAAAVLLFVSVVFGQTISITGTVSSSGGQPIQGAVVKLFVQAVACTSKADGSYSLGGQVSTIGAASHPHMQGISYKNKSFIFNVPSSMPASVKLYNLSGRMAAKVFSGILKKGETSVFFPLDRFGHAMWMVHVTMGSEKATYALASNSSGKNFTLSAPTFTNGKLPKVLAITDWLQGSKAGFAASIQQISSYTGVINITLGTPPVPNFGTNVNIFDPTMQMSTIQSKITNLYGSTGQFSSQRTAYLFKPGSYSLDVTINYYIQAYGLGKSPEDVQITGLVEAPEGGTQSF